MTHDPRRAFAALQTLLELPPEGRPAALERFCGDDRELRREVEALLALEGEAEDFLGGPAVPVAGEGAPGSWTGSRFGPYKLLERIGRGGMGSVYLAAREDDFEKKVAIKLVERHLASEAILRRFHTERQILADLEHPSIARLLDGGTTPEGIPYLVMEHIEGTVLDVYCDHRRLSTRERLELFLQVCSAVGFAHRNLVVHRDIKPGNILVTEEGQARLLDFGIAKLLDPEPGSEAALTRTAERPMTPHYASPEQVLLRPITTASDIYSLGVLLYRLLTGRLPCELEACTPAEVARRICEREPTRPSTAVLQDAEVRTGEGICTLSAAELSRPRALEPAQLRRSLSGDLDAIVLKALRKEPRLRYGSVEQLAADITRYLQGLPVLARRGSALYRGEKFLRRHRLGLGLALLVLLLAAAFGIFEWRRLESERLRAERMTTALKALISVADPDAEPGPFTPASILEEGYARLEELPVDPELRSELLATLGRIHRRLGNDREAGELLAESLRLWRRQHPEPSVDLAVRINNLAALRMDRGEFDEAEALLRQALATYEALGVEGSGHLEDSRHLVVNLNNLATVRMHRGAYAETESLYARGLAIRERLFGLESPEVASSLRSLGALAYSRGDLAGAEAYLAEALAGLRSAHGENHTKVASVHDLLGRVYLGLEDLDAAEQHCWRGLEIRLQELGPESFATARSERNLAELMIARGELATARVLLTRARANLERARPGHWRVAEAESVLGFLWTREGRREEGLHCLEASHGILLERTGKLAASTREAHQRLDSARDREKGEGP